MVRALSTFCLAYSISFIGLAQDIPNNLTNNQISFGFVSAQTFEYPTHSESNDAVNTTGFDISASWQSKNGTYFHAEMMKTKDETIEKEISTASIGYQLSVNAYSVWDIRANYTKEMTSSMQRKKDSYAGATVTYKHAMNKKMSTRFGLNFSQGTSALVAGTSYHATPQIGWSAKVFKNADYQFATIGLTYRF